MNYFSVGPLRILTTLLVGAETLIALYYILIFHETGRSDAIANIAVASVTLIVSAIYAVFVLPALILVVRNDRLELALTLALAAIVAAGLTFILI